MNSGIDREWHKLHFEKQKCTKLQNSTIKTVSPSPGDDDGVTMTMCNQSSRGGNELRALTTPIELCSLLHVTNELRCSGYRRTWAGESSRGTPIYRKRNIFGSGWLMKAFGCLICWALEQNGTTIAKTTKKTKTLITSGYVTKRNTREILHKTPQITSAKRTKKNIVSRTVEL